MKNRKSIVGNSLKAASLNAEYNTILEALRQTNYNKSKAARILNIDRKTLYNKLEDYKHLNIDQ
jgi:two-component system response regulator HydG